MSPRRITLGVVCLFGLICLTGSGCALWRNADKVDADTVKEQILRKIPIAQDAIELEIMFVDRPPEDPLIGLALWDEVDQLSGMSPESREMLRQNGFQIGHASSHPPRALQKLLGLKADDLQTNPQLAGIVGRRVVVRSGAETDILVSQTIQPQSAVTIRQAAATDEREYEHARGMFRVKAFRTQDGWAELEFIPEIHHDQPQMRHVAILTGGFQFQATQKIEKLYSQKFTLTLNLGEMAIITANSHMAGSLGRFFFVDELGEEPSQRMLVVRLANMAKAEPIYAE